MFNEEMDIYIVLRFSLIENLLITERKKNDFIVDNSGRYHLKKLIKVLITNNGTNQNCVPPHRMQWEDMTSLLWYSFLRYITRILSWENSSNKLRVIWQNKWPAILKCQGHKNQGKTREFFKVRRLKRYEINTARFYTFLLL